MIQWSRSPSGTPKPTTVTRRQEKKSAAYLRATARIPSQPPKASTAAAASRHRVAGSGRPIARRAPVRPSDSGALGPEGPPFQVRVEPDRDAVRLVLVGELDLDTVGVLDEQMRELRTVGFRRWVLDLRKLSFIDSSGLRLLITANAGAREAGTELRLIQGPPQIQRVFEITGLLDVLPFGTP